MNMLKLKSVLSSAAVFAAAVIALAPAARAGCGSSRQPAAELPFKDLKAKVAQQEAEGPGGNLGIDAMTGLWKFTFTIKDSANNDVTIDAGFQTWHADGTEITNSSHPPVTGSFCMGVWERIAPRTYKVNHYAMPWDASGQHPLGTDHIRMLVVLGPSGDTFSGTFSVDALDLNGNPVAHVEGAVAAIRIKVD